MPSSAMPPAPKVGAEELSLERALMKLYTAITQATWNSYSGWFTSCYAGSTSMPRFTLSKSVVLAGLALVVALFAEEGLHLNRYDRKGEPHVMRGAARAACTPLEGSPGYAWCTVPGFGRALYRCTQRECGFQEPSAIPVSPQEMEREEADWKSMFPMEEKSK